jgi:hypothetical protein
MLRCDAIIEYLKRHTKGGPGFLAVGTSTHEVRRFTLNGAEYEADPDTVYVGYEDRKGNILVAWGNPQNAFVLHGERVVLLPDGEHGADLLCRYERDDIGGGYHIRGVQSITMGDLHVLSM